MAATTPLGMARTLPQPPSSFSSSNNGTTVTLKHLLGLKKSSIRVRRTSNFCCRCVVGSHFDYDPNPSSSSTISSSSTEWDWNRWVRHFSEIEQAETNSSFLKSQLEKAVEEEDFQEASKLKSAIAEATSIDTVAEIMSELKKAVDEERYHDASRLSRSTGSGLIGWWIGSAKDSEDPFGRLVRITPGVGKFIGRSYTPRQLVTASPGTTLFEIYVVKDTDGTYMMQVVYLQRSKGTKMAAVDLQPKPSRDSPFPESEDSQIVDIQADIDKAEKQEGKEGKILNIEGATEEGIKSVINFLKDKIPGLKVKVMNINVGDEAVNDDTVKRLGQEEPEYVSENSGDEDDDLDEVDDEADKLTVEGNSESMEDEKDVDMKVFVGGIAANEDNVSSKEYIRLPGHLKDAEKDSFILHIPGISGSEENMSPNSKVAAAAQGLSELMPSDFAKAFLGSNKISPKISRDVREIVKLAVGQAQKKSKLSEYTKFSKIAIPRGKTDPFDGLYVGAFGPYGTEIVQLSRKYGYWSSGNEVNGSSDVEFFEYVEAVKLTGDLNVPAGQVTFRAKIGKANRFSNRGLYPDELGVVASYKGQGRIAEFGFKNPKWVEGELLQLSGKVIGPYIRGADLGFLYIVPEHSFLVLFNRLNLPE